ncbi:hypothetical protein PtB15_7B289 [Puccinia triticina]|nr:hypothetical protein PtB15_7B289 [Puccinia triticina]
MADPEENPTWYKACQWAKPCSQCTDRRICCEILGAARRIHAGNVKCNSCQYRQVACNLTDIIPLELPSEKWYSGFCKARLGKFPAEELTRADANLPVFDGHNHHVEEIRKVQMERAARNAGKPPQEASKDEFNVGLPSMSRKRKGSTKENDNDTSTTKKSKLADTSATNNGASKGKQKAPPSADSKSAQPRRSNVAFEMHGWQDPTEIKLMS